MIQDDPLPLLAVTTRHVFWVVSWIVSGKLAKRPEPIQYNLGCPFARLG